MEEGKGARWPETSICELPFARLQHFAGDLCHHPARRKAHVRAGLSRRHPAVCRTFPGTNGSLYGGTRYGGEYGLGTVYKIAPDGDYTILHDFTGASDGAGPFGGVMVAGDGVIYGTTPSGGDPGCN